MMTTQPPDHISLSNAPARQAGKAGGSPAQTKVQLVADAVIAAYIREISGGYAPEQSGRIS